MNTAQTEHFKEILRKGRNMGATAGAIVFFVAGIIPAIYFGSTVTLSLIAKLSGSPVEPTVFVRIAVVLGIALAITCIAFLSIVTGSVIGTAVAYGTGIVSLLLSPPEGVDEGKPALPSVRARGTIPYKVREQVSKRLSFLESRADEVHSVILIGSHASGLGKSGSDIDVVIICTDNGYEPFREHLFGKEIDEGALPADGAPFEFIVLDRNHTEKIHRTGSPFAHALCNGYILKDDGYLAKLLHSSAPGLPDKTYYMETFYEHIAVQYYGVLTGIEKDARKKNCSLSCCNGDRSQCPGLMAAERLAKIIVKMMYITLPAQGHIPLSKQDVIDFGGDLYGNAGREALMLSVRILRSETSSIYFDDYRLLKPFAARLFREVLGIVGKDDKVISILKNAVRLVRGEYSAITDKTLAKCVI